VALSGAGMRDREKQQKDGSLRLNGIDGPDASGMNVGIRKPGRGLLRKGFDPAPAHGQIRPAAENQLATQAAATLCAGAASGLRRKQIDTAARKPETGSQH
jgi:hypothetical protein